MPRVTEQGLVNAGSAKRDQTKMADLRPLATGAGVFREAAGQTSDSQLISSPPIASAARDDLLEL